jgi:plasmid maintenance system killer protein
MVLQVVVSKQLRDFDLGRHRLQFLYQGPDAFSQVNQPAMVGQMKSDAGFATVAGVELTLLDCVRYFHKAADRGPANRLEQLKSDRAGQWSLRVNDQFRICFRWTGADAEDIEIMDYH